MDHQHIEAYLRYLTLAGKSPVTITTYRQVLQLAARSLGGLCAWPDDIAAWITGQRAGNTRYTYTVVLRGFYRWCIRTGRISADPTAELPIPRKPRGMPRPVADENLHLILTEAREPVRLWSHLAAYAGARCVEISRVDRADITAETTYLFGKGDRPRAVPTHPELWRVVRDLPPGPLAGGCTPRAVSVRMIREYRRLGLRVTPHQLRHWAGTGWQAATGDLRVTQELLGHASPDTTAMYAAVADARKRAAVLGLSINGEAAIVDGPSAA